jgi:energy-coupling factor transporter ATP-binding protein EcfA2
MIHADRDRVPGPSAQWHARAAQATERVMASLAEGEAIRFDPGVTRDARPPLVELFASKCAYCESGVGVTDVSQVELFRPRAKAVNLDGETTSGYWWLAYSWSNCYLACAVCNRNKANRFPVAGPRARGPEDDLRAELGLLLDPCQDDPGEHLLFSADGRVASCSPAGDGPDRGAITIDILGLNRPSLVAARKVAAEALRDRFALGREGPAELIHPASPYQALQRQVLEELQAQRRPGTSPTDAAIKQQIFVYQEAHEEDLRRSSVSENVDREALQSQKIAAVEIENFRGIDRLSFEFGTGTPDRAGWTMLLGENGVGKSSVLQALALALMGEETRQRLSELAPADVLRRGTRAGHIRVSFAADSQPLEVRLTPTEIQFGESSTRPRMILLGFGSSRWLPRPGGFEPDRGEFIRVHNLFNPFVPLADTLGWLRSLDDPTFEKTEQALLRLLRMDAGEDLVRVDEEILVRTRGQPLEAAVPVQHLSDGYQAVIAMVGDVMELLSPKRIDMASAEGLVLIDEIGSHLHPRWKMQVVSRLREAFPNLQFVVTTHEPLCLRGLRDADDQVLVLRRDSHGHTVAVTDLPSVESLRVDQLLTSPHFGLHSTMDEEVEALFTEYYDLLARPRRTKAQDARREELRKRLDTREYLGANQREQMMLDAIDGYLAREADALRARKHERLKEETRQALAAILHEADPIP